MVDTINSFHFDALHIILPNSTPTGSLVSLSHINTAAVTATHTTNNSGTSNEAGNHVNLETDQSSGSAHAMSSNNHSNDNSANNNVASPVSSAFPLPSPSSAISAEANNEETEESASSEAVMAATTTTTTTTTTTSAEQPESSPPQSMEHNQSSSASTNVHSNTTSLIVKGVCVMGKKSNTVCILFTSSGAIKLLLKPPFTTLTRNEKTIINNCHGLFLEDNAVFVLGNYTESVLRVSVTTLAIEAECAPNSINITLPPYLVLPLSLTLPQAQTASLFLHANESNTNSVASQHSRSSETVTHNSSGDNNSTTITTSNSNNNITPLSASVSGGIKSNNTKVIYLYAGNGHFVIPHYVLSNSECKRKSTRPNSSYNEIGGYEPCAYFAGNTMNGSAVSGVLEPTPFHVPRTCDSLSVQFYICLSVTLNNTSSAIAPCTSFSSQSNTINLTSGNKPSTQVANMIGDHVSAEVAHLMTNFTLVRYTINDKVWLEVHIRCNLSLQTMHISFMHGLDAIAEVEEHMVPE